MVANVPHETVCDDMGIWWCYGDIQFMNVNVYGMGDTEAEATASFFASALERYMALTVIDDAERTADERREIAYFQRWRDTDPESGRNGENE